MPKVSARWSASVPAPLTGPPSVGGRSVCAVGCARGLGDWRRRRTVRSPSERDLCEHVAGLIRRSRIETRNFAGQTSLEEYIERAAACQVYLTNDSGAMHISSALGVPTVAVFGATNHITTGPTGPLARVICRDVECSPCLLRHCPIDHRCMAAVSSEMVADAALQLLQLK